jgi:hypothetical protein
MGLMPDEFWSLTWTEFHIKHEAFVRTEDRQRALVFELAGLIGLQDEKGKIAINRSASMLRRYALKPWLPQP